MSVEAGYILRGRQIITWLVWTLPVAIAICWVAAVLYRLFVSAAGGVVEGVGFLLGFLPALLTFMLLPSAAKRSFLSPEAGPSRLRTAFGALLIMGIVLLLIMLSLARLDGFPRDTDPLIAERSEYLLYRGQQATPAPRWRFIALGLLQPTLLLLISFMFSLVVAGLRGVMPRGWRG